MKRYIKPALKGYDMAPVSILEGSSTEVKARIGISTFFTDDDDWSKDENTGEKKYNFWE